jgi:tetratricopeptide (TPR) repeat protein
VQVLRSLVVHPEGPRAWQPLVTPEIGQLIPELSSETNRSSHSDPDQARFRLFDSVATMLKDVARSQPLVLVFDDLHEADQASLEMLKFIARGLRDSQIVVIGNYRDAEVRRSRTLSQAIGELLREGDQIPLVGLDESEVARMVEARAALVPSPSFVADLHRATAGNPLFADGVVRVLIAEGKLAGAERLDLSGFKLPEGSRGAIRKRLAMLSADAQVLLAVAAVIGQEFDSGLVERVSSLSVEKLSDLLAEAAGAGIIVALGGARYRFTHPLIREALYNESAAAERIATHRRIGDALEEIYASDISPHLAELAHHYRQSRDIDKAIGYSIRAGDAASATFAFEEAITHWSAALELAEHQPADDLRLTEILSRLGDLLARGGNKLGIEHLQHALSICERRGEDERAAQLHASLARYFGGTLLQTLDLPRALEHCAKAEELVGGAPHESLSRAYFAIAWVEAWKVNSREGLVAARRALEIAEALGNERLRAAALAAVAYATWPCARLGEAFELFEGCWSLGDQLDELPAIMPAMSSCGFSLNWLRDVRALKVWISRELMKPRQNKNPSRQVLLHFAVIGHTMAGDIAEARRIQSECKSKYPGTAEINSAWLDYADGNIASATARFRSLAGFARKQGRRENICCYEIELGCLQILSRDYEAAHASFSEVLSIASDGGHVPFQLNAWEGLAHTYARMHRLDDARSALAQCHAIISDGEDWRGLVGYVARTEALLEAAQGDWAVAGGKFAEAIETMRRHECFWEQILTLCEWGRTLRDVGPPTAADEKFDEAIKLLESSGADQRWIDYLEAARRPPRNDTTLVAGQFRREGQYWTVCFGGETFRLKDSKSLRVIAHLMRSPGHQFHARELAALDNPNQPVPHDHENVGATVSTDLGDAGVVLDAQAVVQYRRRLEDLRPEIEEAERCNDLGRVSLLREEAEVLTAELAAGVGFRGRERRTSSHSERARLSVTKNIRGAIEKIREANPALGRHLANSIKTGYLCSYSPDPANPIVWRS